MEYDKESILNDVRLLVLAVVGGFAIGIGGTLFLSVDVKIVGALLFTVGLYAICVHGLNLYTGKIGYLPERNPEFIIDLVMIWTGNLLGTLIAALLILSTRVAGISEKAQALCQVKNEDSMLSLFILGVFCGFLMYVAVEGYSRTKNPIILFMGVVTFILCGFEHCIADMFYYSVAGMWDADALLRIVVITAGNSLGGMLIPLGKKISVGTKQPMPAAAPAAPVVTAAANTTAAATTATAQKL